MREFSVLISLMVSALLQSNNKIHEKREEKIIEYRKPDFNFENIFVVLF